MFEAHEVNAEHKDLIHDVAHDYYGRRMATCSSDQYVKVSTKNTFNKGDTIFLFDGSLILTRNELHENLSKPPTAVFKHKKNYKLL